MDAETIASRLKHWDLALKREHPDIRLEGSPERALTRTVVEDALGRLFILERIPAEHYEKKTRIARQMEALKNAGLATISPYWPARGDYLIPAEGDWWQLQPLLPTVPVDRDTYADEGWRGSVMAGFLVDLVKASAGFTTETPFSLPVYARRIGRLLEEKHPAPFHELADVWNHLEEGLFRRYDSLPMRFVHGDFHPLNILWKRDGIRAVIDWEFCGFKPALYDAALLAGCIGFDSPDYLTRPLLTTFLGDLRKSGFGDKAGWASFIDLTLAIRIAWLREWMVKKDGDALDQEVTYMQLLHDNRGLLEKRWGLANP